MFVSRRDEILEMRRAALSQNEIARRLGVSPPTVSYHMRRLGFPPQPKARYDWLAIRAYYDAGHSMKECQRAFGFPGPCWYDAICRGVIVPRPRAMPIATLLSGRRSRYHVKTRLLEAGPQGGPV